MDRASFELIGNVGKLEIKPLKGDKKLAIVSLATSERWKAESGDWNEKTYWHRLVVFAPAKVALIEKAVQVGTRLRLVGQIRPGSWEDERGQTRYSIEFVVTGLGDVEILARGKPKPESQEAEPPVKAEKARKTGCTASSSSCADKAWPTGCRHAGRRGFNASGCSGISATCLEHVRKRSSRPLYY